MLKKLLDEKKCFKLVCGAGNEDIIEIEKLTTIYSLAGANFFDVCANPQVVVRKTVHLLHLIHGCLVKRGVALQCRDLLIDEADGHTSDKDVYDQRNAEQNDYRKKQPFHNIL